jgi:hypothetical protein
MTNLFGSLDIEIWDFLEICCLEIEISEVLNTRDIVSKNGPSIEYSTVKLHTKVLRSEVQPGKLKI